MFIWYIWYFINISVEQSNIQILQWEVTKVFFLFSGSSFRTQPPVTYPGQYVMLKNQDRFHRVSNYMKFFRLMEGSKRYFLYIKLHFAFGSIRKFHTKLINTQSKAKKAGFWLCLEYPCVSNNVSNQLLLTVY